MSVEPPGARGGHGDKQGLHNEGLANLGQPSVGLAGHDSRSPGLHGHGLPS